MSPYKVKLIKIVPDLPCFKMWALASLTAAVCFPASHGNLLP